MYASLSIFLLLSILPTYEEIVYSKGINYKFPDPSYRLFIFMSREEKKTPAVPGALRKRSALTEGLAVGALIHGGVYFVGAHQNAVQRAVVLVFAVMGALVHGAFNALIGMTIHCFFLLLNEFGLSIA